MTTIQSDAKNDDSKRERPRRSLRRVQDVDLRNKIVLVRVDHNAVKDAQISDAFRIESSIPTLYSIVERGGRPIVMTHVNRPRDKKTKTIAVDEKDGTRAIAKYLTKKLGVVFANPKVDSSLSTTKGNERENEADAAADDDDGGSEMSQIFKDGTMQTMIKDLKERRIGGIYLPNMRWFSGEERGTEEIGIRLARELASIADVFVNDAFGSWQPHVSTFEVAKLLPSYAGLLMQRELDAMTRVLEPKRPFVAVVAGSKVNTKIGTLVNVAKKCDTLIIGGMIYIPQKRNFDKITELENAWPDVLADLAEELRAGMGVESALDAIANGRNDKMGLMLRDAVSDMRDNGFGNAMKTFAKKSESPMISRIVSILNVALASSGSIATTLEKISDEFWEIYMLKKFFIIELN